MSWKGFQKAMARLPHQIAKTAGYTSETRDEEFDAYESAFKQMDTLARQLCGDARRFKDSLNLMLAHQSSLAKTFQEMFASFSEETSKTTLAPDLDSIERLVVAPTGDMITVLDQVKKLLVKRSHKLVDYDRHRESAQKLRERTDRTIADEKRMGQIEYSLDQATREYTSINNQLKQELPIILSLRIEFIDPCLLVFYSYQHRVYQAMLSSFSRLVQGNFDTKSSALDGFMAHSEAMSQLIGSLVIPKRTYLRSSNSTSGEPTQSSGLAGDMAASGTGSSPAGSMSAPPPYSLSSSSSIKHQSPSGGAYAPNMPQPNSSYPTTGMIGEAGAMGHSAAPSASRVIPPPPSSQSATKYAIALYDFTAQAEGDLSFHRDDKIEIVQRTNDVNDWWIGKLNGKVGSFPAN
eukprot:jgi/Hompol1/5091/HPOL_000487-RA